MRTRSALAAGAGAGTSSSQVAASPNPVAAPSARSTASRRELRPRRAAEIRGAPPGATTPHAAPRTRNSGRVTRGLAAQIRPNSTDSSDDDDSSPPPLVSSTPQRSRTTRASVISRPKRAARSWVATSTSSVGNVRLRKRSHPSGFYDEDSDSDDHLDNAYLSPSPEEDHPAPTTTAPRRTTPRVSKFKKTKLVAKSPRREKAKAPNAQPISDALSKTENAFIPPWTTLPYFVLVQIFECAAALLNDRDGVNWLLSTSRICRAFAEPAMTALYRCPALLTRPMAHRLLDLLSRDPSTTTFNYRAKVEKLRIDVGDIAAKRYKGKHLDFGALISKLPRLGVIDFHHSKDLPPYRRLDENLRWHYPPALFDTLNGLQDDEAGLSEMAPQPTRLVGWRWNRRMMGPDMDMENLRTFHLTPSFANLKKLSFVNFQVPSLHAVRKEDDPESAAKDLAFVRSVANAISALPDLEYLSMGSSTVVNEHFLPLLPMTLKTLELINCWDINGEDFATYLVTHGYKLQELNLHHNQSLSLAFLTVLGSACPNLRSLRMDLKTYNHHEFYNDSDPNYEHLLTPAQVPHWPEALETLELKNMRKWEADGAEMLFQSLVDSAPRLPNLRYLDLKAMLDIPIRQRSEIRDRWEAKLKRVFLRKLESPLPLRSLRQEDPAGGDTRPSPKSRKSTKSAAIESPSRRSGRIATQMSNPSSRASSMGRDLRRNAQGRPSYAEPDTDDDDDIEQEEGSSPLSSAADVTHTAGSAPTSPSVVDDFFRHGMCEKVEIQLDNQKPTESLLTMDDFLDNEETDDASDEDWNGDRDDDTGYAW